MGHISTLGYAYYDGIIGAVGNIVDNILGRDSEEQIEVVLQTRKLQEVLHSWNSMADFWS